MKELVLVVEKNLELRENIAELLELSGYHVLACADSVQGYELAAAQHPDMIIYDLAPVTEIITFFRLVKQDDSTSIIPLMLLDGVLLSSTAKHILEDVNAVRIHKPFTREELLNAVNQTLESTGKTKN